MQALEIPVFSPMDGALAALRGANRLELNHGGSYSLGGTTPTMAELAALREMLDDLGCRNVGVRVMVRPRGPPDADADAAGRRQQDFVYSDEDYAAMENTINEFKQSRLLGTHRDDGFVFGILKRGGDDGRRQLRVDGERNGALVKLALPFASVFHRAFDDLVGDDDCTLAEKTQQAVRDVSACGFVGILTSGGPGKAVENGPALQCLAKLVAETVRETGVRMDMIVGGGVRAGDIKRISPLLLLREGPSRHLIKHWAHSSCYVIGGGEQVGRMNGDEVARLAEELVVAEVDGRYSVD